MAPSDKPASLKRIDLRDLRCFVAVAEAGSISAAAQRLHMSQPPLSVLIKAMESALAVHLLRRHRSGVELTEAGKALLEEAKSVLDRADRGLQHVLQVGRGELGEVRIGIVNSIMWGSFPALLSQFQIRYPQVIWSLHEHPPTQQVAALLDHRIDVGIWRGGGHVPPGIKSLWLSSEKVMAVLPATHRLARRRVVGLTELNEMPFLSMDVALSGFATDILAAIRTHGHEPRIAHVAPGPQTLLALAAHGIGYALLPASLSRIQWPGAVFRPVRESLPPADLYLYTRDQPLAPAVRRFLEVMHVAAP